MPQPTLDTDDDTVTDTDIADDPVTATARAYSDTVANDADAARQLHFVTQMLDPETAAECVEQIGMYNAFDPDVITEFLHSDELDDSARVAVAREYSPAIYIYSEDLPSVLSRFFVVDRYVDDFMVNTTDGRYPRGEFYRPEFDEIDDTVDSGIARFWWD